MDPALSERDDRGPARGRPRSSAVSGAILEAALDLIAERGNIADVSVEAVAERGGVSKATIYRRWSSKEELLAAAVDSIKAPMPERLPHRSLRDDLVFIGDNFRHSAGSRDRKVFKCMMLASKDPEYRKYQDHFMDRRRRYITNLFEYWAERGELRSDVDPELAAAMFTSPLLTILVYGNYADLKSPDIVERVVDNLLRGLGTK